MTDRERRAEEIFYRALEREGGEQKAFLEKACGGDADLRAEVESLLQHQNEAGSFLEQPAEGVPDEVTELDKREHAERDQIGPYKLLHVLGEGGMGEVWLAEQSQPIRRDVALKIIRRGLDSKEIIARFEAERQALALMDHPCVAKVFDAGSTPRGRPYFVMEHVKGVPITDYCDRQRLSIRERLELFAQTCEGVQHAHQKAIIHRDLKPSNVLVTEHDGKPVPKIIDFGVAKATAQKLTEKTMATQLGVLIGTPEYMSPEQADLTGNDIDTRTDVYALGVMLYELLVGALPIDAQVLRRAGLDAIRKKIREDEPLRPSTRLSSLGEKSTASAQARRVDLPTLQRQLRGDLDWITMKALEKDRARRYGSPAELAADVQRHLDDDPVLAGPPSARYRLGKFVRRHRTSVVAASVLGLGLIVGVAGVSLGLVRAREEARRANQQAETAEQVSDFLVKLFKMPDPSEAKGNSVTAREILDRGATQIRDELADQPRVRARLMHTMSAVYQGLGLYTESKELATESLREAEPLLSAEHPDVIGVRHQLARTMLLAGELQEAKVVLEKTLADNERARGKEDRRSLYLRGQLADVLSQLGDNDTARSEYEQLIRSLETVHGDDHEDVAVALNNYAMVLQRQGEFEAALQAFERSHEILQVHAEEGHPRLAQAMINASAIRAYMGEWEEATKMLREALPVVDKVFGPDHPEAVGARMNLAVFHFQQGEMDAARTTYYDVLERAEKTFGPEHPQTAAILNNMGEFHLVAEEPTLAKPLLERALKIRRQVLGDEHPSVAATLAKLASAYAALGEVEPARSAFLELITLDEKMSDDEGLVNNLQAYAEFKEDNGEDASAERARAEAIRNKLASSVSD
jgi:serine/threonine protein kinase/tetratricopeptide (TPR) repeat protein